jgi:hypothetical protein
VGSDLCIRDSDRPAAGGLLVRVAGVHYLPRLRYVRDARELHPLDVTYNRDARPARLHVRESHTHSYDRLSEARANELLEPT